MKRIDLGICYNLKSFCSAKSKRTRTVLDFATGREIPFFFKPPFACLAPYSATHHCEAKSVGLDQFHHLSRGVSSAASGRSTKQTNTKKDGASVETYRSNMKVSPQSEKVGSQLSPMRPR